MQVCYIETTVCLFACVDNDDMTIKIDLLGLNGINQALRVSGNQKSKVSDPITLRGFSVRIGVSDNKSFTSA